MTPYYADDWLTIYSGDAGAVLATLPADSVDCVVTSPPYWGLRDYGTATWVGGDEACDHKQTTARHDGGRVNMRGFHGSAKPDSDKGAMNYASTCGKCGATRVDSQLGLERTPEEYVANMVAVFAEVRRVLKPSGTCWLNLGDSYNAYNGNAGPASGIDSPTGARSTQRPKLESGHGLRTKGLKPKDLVGIPWRVAFALQADGWYLRSDIIWAKPNPMPESVTDRPTKAHEYLFLLTKSARYFFDADAVREDGAGRLDRGKAARGRIGEQGWKQEPLSEAAGRNIRSVWTIATRPYPGAHFAVFPPELPERCIKAGSSEKGVCPECGASWERVVARTVTASAQRRWTGAFEQISKGLSRPGRFEGGSAETTGWRPTCVHMCGECNGRGSVISTKADYDEAGTPIGVYSETVPCSSCKAEPVPAVVLDPFAGSGTTGMVAQKLGRRAILIDLNPDYLRQQLARNAQTPLGLDVA